MSAAVGTALKKVLVAILTEPKVLKNILFSILVVVVAMILPTVFVVSIFSGDFEVDTASLQQYVEDSLAWRVFDTQYWPGTPQRRRRIYLVVDFGGTTAPTILFDQESLPRDYSPCIRAGEALASTTTAGA